MNLSKKRKKEQRIYTRADMKRAVSNAYEYGKKDAIREVRQKLGIPEPVGTD